MKKKHTQSSPTEQLFESGSLLSTVYGDDEDDDDSDVLDDTMLIDNQRFKKICRLPQLGVYVDEAHHLFGANLEKELRAGTANKTTLRNTINELNKKAHIVACYNYTGTPFVNNQVLPEVVYAYGLKESIAHGYLKDADPIAFENVKNEEFLRIVIKEFWERYGNNLYENLVPKLAIFAATVEEATKVVRPAVEKVLGELGIPISTILVNTGDTTITKDDDIRDFRNLDIPGTEGSKKQFIILDEKGREGWNCRSLLGIALFRSPKSKVFVLQATMRCLRQLTDEQLKATVFLSKENYDILNDELNKNYNMEISDFGKQSTKQSISCNVRVLPPPRTIRMKKISHEYKLTEKGYTEPITFGLSEIDIVKYQSKMTEKGSIRLNAHEKVTIIDDEKINVRYSELTLVAEISRYLNLSCLTVSKILRESIDGINTVLDYVNKYNEILYDIIIPVLFNALYSIEVVPHTEDVELTLLREPKEGGYYEFKGKAGLIVYKNNNTYKQEWIDKTFHADTYCFDSKPELECFLQYIASEKVQEVYFTGMFTADQGDLGIQYYDPESGRIRKYYPDFFAKMSDGTYQLIEVKGDHMIDDTVVKAKKDAAEEMATASKMQYVLYASSRLMKEKVLEAIETTQGTFTDSE